jgi:uncharacterized membrane protein YfcA
MNVLALALAAVIGLSLGLLGGGGSILAVPTFVYVLRFPPKQAIAMSLLVVQVMSLVGAYGHWRAGNLYARLALSFGLLSFLGSFTAARLSAFVSGEVQIALLGGVMLAAAVPMFRNVHAEERPHAEDPSPLLSHHLTPGVVVAALAVGLLTGLIGVGGGFLFVPALVLLGRVPIKPAVGTSSLVIAINSFGGLLGYGTHVAVPWRFLAAFTLVAVGGIMTGTRLVRHVRPVTLRRAFAVFLVVVGALMLYDKGRALLRTRPPNPSRTAET